MTILILINDAPYGTEKVYNALRLAMALQKEHADVQVNVFLMADAVGSMLAGQTTPQGYYNVERMVKSVIQRGGMVWACGTCAAARALTSAPRVEGVEIRTIGDLASWAVAADKVFTF